MIALGGPAGAADGVVEINQARALAGGVTATDAPGFPVTIDAPGSYILTGDLVVADSSAAAVDVTANHVTLDLNGFRVEGVPSSAGGTATGIVGTGSLMTLRNGFVQSFGSHGVHLSGVGESRIEGIRAFSNGGTGIKCGPACVLADSHVRYSGADGIECEGNCEVRRCRSSANAGSGIVAGARSVVVDGYVNQNAFSEGQTGDGIQVAPGGARVEGNYVEDHQHGHGISAGDSSVAGNVVLYSAQDGIHCYGICVVRDNVVQGATLGISVGNGSAVSGNAVRISTSYGLSMLAGGYSGNVLTSNNGGDANPQVDGGTDLGGNLCGTRTTCP